jgi:5'-nucleotidase
MKISSISNIKYRKIFKFLICVFDFWILIFCFTSFAYAKEITILYTGDTHAMLYPCNCPKEPDGGIARRQALIKQLRRSNSNTLILDSGGFFAGGLKDEYTQNTQLDTQRTLVNLKAMELMKYDAVTIGNDEFNFGKEFLEENISKTKLAFLSCNIKSDRVLPYIIKDIAGIKIGIIGVTSLSAMQKAGGLNFIEPKIAVGQAVEALKKNKANIIILLSNLGESEDLNLIKQVGGIDILITGYGQTRGESPNKVGSTFILRIEWQGRRLGKASFTITDKKITKYKIENLRLSDKIADDSAILAILPRCFSDSSCKKEGYTGTCQEPGSINSRCIFSEVTKANLLIITSKSCLTCTTEMVVKFLKAQFPGLIVSYLYYPEAKAKKMMEDFNIEGLPVYLLGREIEKEKAFSSLNLKDNTELKGDFYMLKPAFVGFSYYVLRQPIKNRIDLFVSLYDKNTEVLLDTMKEYKPVVHFLAVEKDGGFDAASGNLEIEEYLRGACVQKYYPQIFWDYISCRVKNINSSWWDDCASGLDTDRIKTCAKGDEGKTLLKENISLNRDLGVMFGPTYLMDNQQIFSSKGSPTKEEFKKIFFKR